MAMIDWMRKLTTRARGWFVRHDPDAEMAEEIRLHQLERAAELERTGLPADAALNQARREFGNSLLALEGSRSAWHLGWMEDLFTDLRYGARALARDRSFALTAILSLALGIGVNTTIFSLAAEFLFSEASVREPGRVVGIRLGGNSHAQPEELRYLRETGIYQDVAGYREAEINWRNGESSRRVFAFEVSPNYFPSLGIPLAFGRPIQPGDLDVVIVSHRFWRSSMQARADALNRTLTLNGRPHTVIAVLPANHRTVFGFGLVPEIYLPVNEERQRLALFARMRDGMTRAEAAARTSNAAQELDRLHPNPDYQRARGIEVSGLIGIERLTGKKMMPMTAFFAMLMAVVSLVLLIACTNVASLMLARASARGHELAIRASIGAGRGRIVRQLLAEALLLAGLATGAGIGLNLVLTSAINRIRLPIPAPIALSIEPDWRLLLYGAAIAVLTTLATGLLPAYQAARFAGPSALLNQGMRQAGGGGASRLRSALVAGQVAVTFVVLATAFLFLRNLTRSSAMSPGFEVNRLVWASMRLVPERYAAAGSIEPLNALGLERLRALPGVESASLVRVVPFNDQETQGGTVYKGDDPATPLRVQRVINGVSPDFFRTMGIGLVAGRAFQEADTKPGAPGLAVINQEMARQIWGGANPVGRTLKLPGNRVVTVAGVVRNTKFMTIGEDDKPGMYEPYSVPNGDRRYRIEWMIRTPGSPAALTRAVEQALLDLDRSAAVEVKPMEHGMGFALLPSQVGAGLMGAIGLLGLALASIGLYGVLVYGVARRRREIGVRVALGAQVRDVVGLVLRDGAWIMAIGMATGLGIALLVTKPLAMFLVAGLKPADPGSFAAVAIVLSAVALLASVAPALRAVRVPPTEALRGE